MDSKKTSGKWKRRLAIGATALVAIALLVALQPDDSDLAYSSMPNDAVAIAAHYDLRTTWKDQVRTKVVDGILAAYGIDPEEIVTDPGIVWTIRLAVGDLVVSALSGEDDTLCLSAASPAGSRGFLLRFFLAINWVPGLGRLHTSPDGTKFALVGSKRSPLALSFAMRKNLLLAKLAKSPLPLTDMYGDLLLETRLHRSDPSVKHVVTILHQTLVDMGLDEAAGDATLALSIRDGAIHATGAFALDEDGLEEVGEISRHTLTGRNTAVSALAADHAIAILLLPSRYISPLARSILRCDKGPASEDDSAFYLSVAPYGARILAFAAPALTLSVPGLSVSDEVFKAAQRRLVTKSIRRFIAFAKEGEYTFCSSIESLEAQRHAAPATGATWQDSFKALNAGESFAFLHLDLDPFARALSQVLSAIGAASSLGALDLDRKTAATLFRINNTYVPRIPTYATLSATLKKTEAHNRFAIDIQVGQGRK